MPKPKPKPKHRFQEKYLPKTLSPEDYATQKKALIQSVEDYKKGKYHTRPKLKSYPHKKSKHVVDFLDRYEEYGIETMMDIEKIAKTLSVPIESIETILRKGRGAFSSAGSRPNQTPQSWARARLASSLLGRKACNVDQHVFRDVDGVDCDALRKAYASPKGTDLRTILGKHAESPPTTSTPTQSKTPHRRHHTKHHTKHSTFTGVQDRPFDIVESLVKLSAYKNDGNNFAEIKKHIQKSVRAYNEGKKVPKGRSGISSLKAMGLIQRANGTYSVKSTTKPYFELYRAYLNKK